MMDDLIVEWVNRCDECLRKLLPCHSTLLSVTGLGKDKLADLRHLSSACIRTSGAVVPLVEAGRPWEA